jgi:hypothetical protein
LESQNYFKDVRAETIEEPTIPIEIASTRSVTIPLSSPLTLDVKENVNVRTERIDKTEDLLKMLQQQQKILSGILESQIKIIELLQKKK